MKCLPSEELNPEGLSFIANPPHHRYGCTLVESVGTIGFRRQRHPNPASLQNLNKAGFDGKVHNGRKALNRAQKAIEDLEAAGSRPCYLMTLTLPFNVSAEQWRVAKQKFLKSFSKLLGKYGAGCVWWPGFQGSWRPHLHILTDLPMAWSQLLNWAKHQWSLALGQECPENTVDLKDARDFRYTRSGSTYAQAIAPSADNRGG